MATTLDKKPVIRRLVVYERNKQLIAKMAPEGIYLKREKTRWSGALFLPWMSVFTAAAIRYANEKKRLKAEKRKQKKLGK
jgi:hypothetical protein